MGSTDGANFEKLASESAGFVSFVEDICAEDEVLGRKVVDGMLAFLRDRGPERAAKVHRFATVDEYLNFRTGDIARS